MNQSLNWVTQSQDLICPQSRRWLINAMCLMVFSGDAENLAFTPETFDVVLASEVVEHLWNPQKFLDDAYRVLKPKGYLILEAPEGIEGLRYDAHKNWFTVGTVPAYAWQKIQLCFSLRRFSPEWGAPTATINLPVPKKLSSTSFLWASFSSFVTGRL